MFLYGFDLDSLSVLIDNFFHDPDVAVEIGYDSRLEIAIVFWGFSNLRWIFPTGKDAFFIDD